MCKLGKLMDGCLCLNNVDNVVLIYGQIDLYNLEISDVKYIHNQINYNYHSCGPETSPLFS